MGTGNPDVWKKMRSLLVGKRTQDAFLYLFFVLICTIFWFARELEESFSTDVVVPVKLVDVPKGVIVTTDVPKELKLTIHDKGAELIPILLRKHTDTLFISFKNFDNHEPTGHSTLMLSQLQSSLKNLLPDGASILSMTPDTVAFYYNRGLHRRLPVQIQGTLEAASQYCIINTRFTPDSVDIYAPLSVLDTMHAAYTERITLNEVNKTMSMPVRIKTQRGVRVFPDSVTLRTEVDILTRQTLDVPVVGINFPADKTLRTFPSSVKVSYLVPEGQHKNIDPSEFAVVIAYAELLENNTNHCRPHLTNTPAGVTGTLIDPIEVDYLLENIATEESEDNVQKIGRKGVKAKR